MADEDPSGESAPEQELVWPPPDSELDSYTFPLLETGQELAMPAPPDALATPPEALAAPPELVATPPEPEVSTATPTPVPLSLPLSYVLHSHVEFQWHEAVAIVRQLADQLTRGLSLEPQGSLPDVDRIDLEPTGRLLARLDPGGTVPVVRGLGFLLHILLADTGAPARLRLIVSQAVSEVPTFPSVERLMWELAGFERPLRLETLKQLYERAAVARRTRVLVAAAPGPDLHAASRPVSATTGARATEGGVERTVQRRQLSWPALILALLAGAACGALVFAAVIARSPVRKAAPSHQVFAELGTRELERPRELPSPRELKSAAAAPSQKQTDTPQPDPVRPAVHSDISPSQARARPQNGEAVRPAMKSAAETDEIRSPQIGELARSGSAGAQRSSLREVSERAQDLSQRAQREYRRARTLFDQKDYAKASDGFLQVVKLLDDGELTGPLAELRSMASDYSALSRATLLAISEGRVYGSGDAGVTEPVALRLYLPAPAPETPPSRLGVLLLVVNGEGAVESVRLQSPSNRYHDRFWVSVAKTWRFKPALKDGQPVKFLKRIVITEPPLSDPQ